jgi:hypothetical protein
MRSRVKYIYVEQGIDIKEEKQSETLRPRERLLREQSQT